MTRVLKDEIDELYARHSVGIPKLKNEMFSGAWRKERKEVWDLWNELCNKIEDIELRKKSVKNGVKEVTILHALDCDMSCRHGDNSFFRCHECERLVGKCFGRIEDGWVLCDTCYVSNIDGAIRSRDFPGA